MTMTSQHSGPFLAVTCVAFKRRSWQESLQVWSRSEHPTRQHAIAATRPVELKLTRRHDVVAAGTVILDRPDPLEPQPTDAQVLAVFVGSLRTATYGR
jgi:hypothetical protein